MKHLLLFIFPGMLFAAPVFKPIDLRFAESGIFDRADRTLQIEPEEKESQTILFIESPGIRARQYALVGEVRYEDVNPPGYFEMWSVFPTNGAAAPPRYFSKTIADAGPLAKLVGSSAWRTFSLPFDCGEQGDRPESLEFSIVLPGKGKVEIRNLRLIEKPSSFDAWWTEEQARWIGGALGSALGVLGLALSVFYSRQKRAALGISVCIIALAVASLAVAIAGLFWKQPVHVWVPLALAGFVGFSTGWYARSRLLRVPDGL